MRSKRWERTSVSYALQIFKLRLNDFQISMSLTVTKFAKPSARELLKKIRSLDWYLNKNLENLQHILRVPKRTRKWILYYSSGPHACIEMLSPVLNVFLTMWFLQIWTHGAHDSLNQDKHIAVRLSCFKVATKADVSISACRVQLGRQADNWTINCLYLLNW